MADKFYEKLKTIQIPPPRRKKQTNGMKVQPYCINKGQKSQYFGLMVVEGKEKRVLYSAPNNWKTENGAVNWAKKNGFDVKEKTKRKTSTAKPKTKKPAKRKSCAKKKK